MARSKRGQASSSKSISNSGSLAMPSPTEKQRKLYANLMHEVKTRIEVVNVSISGHLRLSDPWVREFCWLQLRMLCELVALSCLVAHGDITFLQPHKVGRAHSADDILDRMTKLREHFYPNAITVSRKLEGAQFIHELRVVDPSPLPKEELLRLYGISHRHLHRGSLKSLLARDINASPLDITIDAPEIVRWAQKLNALLSHHVIAISGETLIICVLRNADDNHNVQVAVAEAGSTLKPEQP